MNQTNKHGRGQRAGKAAAWRRRAAGTRNFHFPACAGNIGGGRDPVNEQATAKLPLELGRGSGARGGRLLAGGPGEPWSNYPLFIHYWPFAKSV